jgi:hypothetical protein
MMMRVLSLLLMLSIPVSADELVQVHQSFDDDPGWEAINNRIVAEDPPTVRQDFGWRKGEIGGVVSRSRTAAYYAMKVGPLSLAAKMSAAGKIRVMPTTAMGGAYFGFFNSTRQEWRPWSSMAVRINDGDPHQPLMMYDFMTGGWHAGGFTVDPILADGSTHTWRIAYDPDATVAKDWADAKLHRYLDDTKRNPEEEILTRAKVSEPDITLEQLQQRLAAAADQGLIVFNTRRGVGWDVRHDPQNWKGKMSFQLDDHPLRTNFLNLSQHDDPSPTVIDRFGIFNWQLPGPACEFYLSDLVVNGQKIDLSRDPNWDAKGNRTTFAEQDFHAKQDFGFSKTNHAGDKAGEIGGTFWRTEPIDPLHGFYADEVGALTMDDAISFSGHLAFTAGATDAGMFFGYFNKAEEEVVLTGRDESGAPLPSMMGFAIEGPTRIGYFFSSQFTPVDRRLSSAGQGPQFVPDGKKHAFTFAYDPKANKGNGQIIFTLDGVRYQHDLNPEQRKSGAHFDHFGMMNLRRGGKYVTVWLDDLTYTARRSPGATPVKHEQKIVKVRYPPGGRRY